MGAVREWIVKPQPVEDRVVDSGSITAQPIPAASRPFALVPTHAVGVASERRTTARAYLRLPMRLVGVEGRRESVAVTLLTQNISAGGVYFLAPRSLEPGTAIELEVGLVDRPFGRGSVQMSTAAHVVRSEPSATLGWHGIAVRFDDFDFRRDESLPPRFARP